MTGDLGTKSSAASTQVSISTAAGLFDRAAWYHILLTSGSGFQGETKIYVNNQEVASSDDTYVGRVNTASPQGIGVELDNFDGDKHFDGLMAEVYMLDGTEALPTDFGEYDSNGLWVPKAYSGGGFGINGFYLDFKNNSSTTALGIDRSGNGNNWTPVNLSVTAGSGDSSMIDHPTNNFATLNPLDGHPSGVDNANRTQPVPTHTRPSSRALVLVLRSERNRLHERHPFRVDPKGRIP